MNERSLPKRDTILYPKRNATPFRIVEKNVTPRGMITAEKGNDFRKLSACKLFEGTMTMNLPETMDVISPETNYHGKFKPDMALKERNGTVTITLTRLPKQIESDFEVLRYQNDIRESLKKTTSNLEWLLGGVKGVNGNQIAFFEVITVRFGVGVYNLSFFMRFHQRMLTGNFMCSDQTLKQWRPVFHQMIESIEVNSNPNLH